MKITFVIPNLNLNGGVRVVGLHAARLRARGHEVTVVASRPRRPRAAEKVKALVRGRGWPTTPGEPADHLDRLGVPWRRTPTDRPVRDEDVPDADVILGTWWETMEWIHDLSPRKGAKVHFIQSHEVFDRDHESRVRAVYAAPTHKITISRWLVDLMRETYGWEATRVPNSVDMEQFHAPPRSRQARPTVGMLYATMPLKGVDVSTAALARLKPRLGELDVVSFGDVAVTPSLPMPESTRHTVLPAQDRIREVYAACDVWLCGSRLEGFHLPPLEAMACGCPVVSTRVGGPMDIIEPGVNGYLVDVEDEAALAERLHDVLTLPPSRWQAMSDAARATAAGYTWDDAASRLEAALEAVLQRDRAVAA